MRNLIFVTLLFSPLALAVPPCDESKGYYEVFGNCYLMNRWDFTLSPSTPYPMDRN